MVVATIRPRMFAAKLEGAATRSSIVPLQRSVWITHPDWNRASHQSAMKTGAIAA